MQLALFYVVATVAWLGTSAKNEQQEEYEKLALDDRSLEKVKNVHRNWYFFAVKALMAQMAKELLHNIGSGDAERLKLCLRRISSTKDLKNTARCLLKAKQHQHSSRSDQSIEGKAFVQESVEKRKWMKDAVRLDFNNVEQSLVKRRKLRRKITIRPIRRRRLKRSPHRLVVSQAMKSDSDLVQVKNYAHLPPLIEGTTKSPVQRVTNLFVSLFGKVSSADLPSKWTATYKNVEKLTKILESNEKLPGARVYGERVYDLVMESGDGKKPKLAEVYVPPFLKDAFDMVNAFNGGKNARILSPRVAPLMPERDHPKGFLSPSLFPFYKDDAEEQIMPVPKMLEDAGLNERDREKVLEMVMEISGARETVDKALKVLNHLSSSGLGDKLFSASEKVAESFERLRASLKKGQTKQLDKRGFTFMEPSQLKKLHDDQGINEAEVKSMVDDYSKLTKEEREDALWHSIAELAGLRKRRYKRQSTGQFVLISVLQPFILSPYQFAPVYGLTVLGPVVLSPNIFSPLILNPAVLSPWVLSPAVPLPFILSPYVLSPYVLNPLVMAPYILTPYALSPNVITPYALSPVILSPLFLCPDLLSPMVLSGPILSPSMLSPSILSKSYLMANVLSPTFLS